MLRSLDLFSGIGGMAVALRGIATPAQYCEIDPLCKQVLMARMADGSLPTAPISSDVRSLMQPGSECIDLITAGWPCQDVSMCGKRRGLAGARSGLVREVMRIADLCQPSLLFLENSPGLVSAGGMDYLTAELGVKRGYELRWRIVGACDVGAPHQRRRWFCLAVKQGYALPALDALDALDAPEGRWDAEPCARLVVPADAAANRECRRRFGMLGNAVVPAAARAAFLQLATGAGAATTSAGSFQRMGPFTLDPAVYTGRERVTREITAQEVTEPVTLAGWPTPRHLGFGPASHVLTVRSRKDLPTALRFASDTPDVLRDRGVINPEWAEWLMGYRSRWTVV